MKYHEQKNCEKYSIKNLCNRSKNLGEVIINLKKLICAKHFLLHLVAANLHITQQAIKKNRRRKFKNAKNLIVLFALFLAHFDQNKPRIQS